MFRYNSTVNTGSVFQSNGGSYTSIYNPLGKVVSQCNPLAQFDAFQDRVRLHIVRRYNS